MLDALLVTVTVFISLSTFFGFCTLLDIRKELKLIRKRVEQIEDSVRSLRFRP